MIMSIALCVVLVSVRAAHPAVKGLSWLNEKVLQAIPGWIPYACLSHFLEIMPELSAWAASPWLLILHLFPSSRQL